jgi:acetyl-CoA acetyltransferase
MHDAVIVGIGAAGPFPRQELSGLRLAADAFLEAVADAGLEPGDVDGLVVNHGQPLGPDYDQFAQYLDLDVRSAIQTWSHGRYSTITVQIATMMIQSGQADAVACVDGYHADGLRFGGEGWHGWREELREGGGPHGEDPSVGLTAPVGTAAMALRAYCETYGQDPVDLFHVVHAQRENARLNDRARRRDPLTLEGYLAAPMIVDPLRRDDCGTVSEGGNCIVLCRADDRRAARGRPIRVLGMQGIPASREEFFWARPGVGMYLQSQDMSAPQAEQPIYTAAAVTRANVDIFYTYDAFSPLIWFALERFGFCRPGEAPQFCRDQGLTVDSPFPLNTSGGMLCEGTAAGWGHVREAVRQLRHEAGPRQVPQAKVAQWGAVFGDSLILAN